jgi:hypothetical protein
VVVGLKLDVIFQANSLVEVQEGLEKHFNQKMRLIKEGQSIFEQWQVRPAGRVFVPKVWTFRVVFKDGVFYFGSI